MTSIKTTMQECIVDRLLDVVHFGKRVRGASDLIAIKDWTSEAIPAAFVVPLPENAVVNTGDPLANFTINRGFMVVVVTDGKIDLTGGHGTEIHEKIRNLLFQKLLGWQLGTSNRFEPITYSSGYIDDFNGGRYHMAFEFSVVEHINPECFYEDCDDEQEIEEIKISMPNCDDDCQEQCGENVEILVRLDDDEYSSCGQLSGDCP